MAEATNPVAATAPLCFVDLSSVANVASPTVSIPPAQRCLSKGFFESSFTSSRSIISLAPNHERKSDSEDFPVEATT